MNPRQAIILAAGLGSRLQALTASLPKALIPFMGRPLLGYAIDFARHAIGTDGRIVVVSGFCADLVERFVADYAPEAQVVFNPDFRKANLRSVATGLTALSGGFLLMNVDHVYPFAFGDRLMSASGDVLLAVDRDRPLGGDDMKVALDADGAVRMMSKQLPTWDCGYIGMTKVSDGASDVYRAAVGTVLAVRPDTAVAEDVIAELYVRRHSARTCDLSGIGWVEIDNGDELVAGERRLAKDPGLLTRGFDAGTQRAGAVGD